MKRYLINNSESMREITLDKEILEFKITKGNTQYLESIYEDMRIIEYLYPTECIILESERELSHDFLADITDMDIYSHENILKESVKSHNIALVGPPKVGVTSVFKALALKGIILKDESADIQEIMIPGYEEEKRNEYFSGFFRIFREEKLIFLNTRDKDSLQKRNPDNDDIYEIGEIYYKTYEKFSDENNILQIECANKTVDEIVSEIISSYEF